MEKPQTDPADWRYATWAGARRAMIERALTLSVRERLEEMDALLALSDRFRAIRIHGAVTSGSPARSESPR